MGDSQRASAYILHQDLDAGMRVCVFYGIVSKTMHSLGESCVTYRVPTLLQIEVA